MKKRIWATLDDYLPPLNSVSYLGRNFANFYFLSALLKYSTFDEFHFYLSNAAHCRLFLEKHASFLERIGVSERVTVRDRLALIDAFHGDDSIVFHQSDHIQLFNSLCRLRNHLGVPVPITAFIHSISYQKYMRQYLEMAMCGASRHDALICSSTTGKQVLSECFVRIDRVASSSRPPIGLPVIPLGIDESTRPLPEKGEAKAQLNFGDDEVIGLVLGRFSDVDKMDLFPLLQAFRAVVNLNRQARLALAGSVHSQSYLHMVQLWIAALHLEPFVRIVTEPDEETKWRLLSASDIFISVADNPQETFGLTILEAMRAGLALLVSDFDGYRELVSDDVGVRVPTFWGNVPILEDLEPLIDERTFHLYTSQSICVDVDSLTRSMNLLFRDGALRQTYSRNARARFESKFSHRRIIGQLESLWMELDTQFVECKSEVDWMSLRSFETFSHYVTRRVQSTDRVRLTSFGQEILDQKTSYPLLSNMASLVDTDAVICLMRATSESMTVTDFEAKAASLSPYPQYVLLWMLKHGLLTMGS